MPVASFSRVPNILQIAQIGHEVLYKECQQVTGFDNPALQELIDDMLATCVEVDGLGLAAPQVYHSVAVFILASRPSPRFPKAPVIEPTPILNPYFEGDGAKTDENWE